MKHYGLVMISLLLFASCSPGAPQAAAVPTLMLLPSAAPTDEATLAPSDTPTPLPPTAVPTVEPPTAAPTLTPSPDLTSLQVTLLSATNEVALITLAAMQTAAAASPTPTITFTPSLTITSTPSPTPLPPSSTPTVPTATPAPPTNPSFSEGEYVRDLSDGLFILAGGRNIENIRVSDGRPNGGERAVIIAYLTTESTEVGYVEEWIDIFSAVAATIRADDLDVDSVTLVAGTATGQAAALLTVDVPTLLRFHLGEISRSAFLASLQAAAL